MTGALAFAPRKTAGKSEREEEEEEGQGGAPARGPACPPAPPSCACRLSKQTTHRCTTLRTGRGGGVLLSPVYLRVRARARRRRNQARLACGGGGGGAKTGGHGQTALVRPHTQKKNAEYCTCGRSVKGLFVGSKHSSTVHTPNFSRVHGAPFSEATTLRGVGQDYPRRSKSCS